MGLSDFGFIFAWNHAAATSFLLRRSGNAVIFPASLRLIFFYLCSSVSIRGFAAFSFLCDSVSLWQNY